VQVGDLLGGILLAKKPHTGCGVFQRRFARDRLPPIEDASAVLAPSPTSSLASRNLPRELLFEQFAELHAGLEFG
jgi:hypothetical protein